MFPILIAILLLILAFFLVWKANTGNNEDYVIGSVFAIIALVVFFIVWPIIYTSSIKTVAEMDAFYKSTKSAYEYSITATEEIEIKALKDMEESKPSLSPMQMFDSGGFAYFKLAPVASERIREFRNRIEWYNSTLESYSRLNKFWFTKSFLADAPSDLKPIILK